MFSCMMQTIIQKVYLRMISIKEMTQDSCCKMSANCSVLCKYIFISGKMHEHMLMFSLMGGAGVMAAILEFARYRVSQTQAIL